MMKMIVMKPFMSEDGLLKTGQIIDGEKFRNTRNLVNARYLRAADDMVPEAPAPGDKAPVMPSKPTAAKAEAVENDNADAVVAEAPKRRTRKKNTEE